MKVHNAIRTTVWKSKHLTGIIKNLQFRLHFILFVCFTCCQLGEWR